MWNSSQSKIFGTSPRESGGWRNRESVQTNAFLPMRVYARGKMSPLAKPIPVLQSSVCGVNSTNSSKFLQFSPASHRPRSTTDRRHNLPAFLQTNRKASKDRISCCRRTIPRSNGFTLFGRRSFTSCFRWWPGRAGAGRRSLFHLPISIISHANRNLHAHAEVLQVELQLLIMLKRWVTALYKKKEAVHQLTQNLHPHAGCHGCYPPPATLVLADHAVKMTSILSSKRMLVIINLNRNIVRPQPLHNATSPHPRPVRTHMKLNKDAEVESRASCYTQKSAVAFAMAPNCAWLKLRTWTCELIRYRAAARDAARVAKVCFYLLMFNMPTCSFQDTVPCYRCISLLSSPMFLNTMTWSDI